MICGPRQQRRGVCLTERARSLCHPCFPSAALRETATTNREDGCAAERGGSARTRSEQRSAGPGSSRPFPAPHGCAAGARGARGGTGEQRSRRGTDGPGGPAQGVRRRPPGGARDRGRGARREHAVPAAAARGRQRPGGAWPSGRGRSGAGPLSAAPRSSPGGRRWEGPSWGARRCRPRGLQEGFGGEGLALFRSV